MYTRESMCRVWTTHLQLAMNRCQGARAPTAMFTIGRTSSLRKEVRFRERRQRESIVREKIESGKAIAWVERVG